MQNHPSLAICIIITLFFDDTQAGLQDGPYDNSQDAWLVFAPVGGGVFLFLLVVGVIAAVIPRHKCGFLRAFSFAFWILFWLTAIFGGTCSVITTCREYSKEVDLLRWICLFSLPLWWIYMLIESGFCKERRIISYLQHARDLDGYLEMSRQVRPTITFHAESYHYLSVNRGGRGDPRILTNTDTQKFNYKYWLDDSEKRLRGLRYRGVTIIKLYKEIIPGDAETALAMDDAKRSLKERNRGNDLHIKVFEVRDIPGFKRRIGAYFNKGCFIGQLQFWIATFFAFTWPYRWIFSCLTTKTRFTVQKKVYISKPETDGASVVNLTSERVTKENGFPGNTGRHDGKQPPLPPPYEMDQFSPMPVDYDMGLPSMKDKHLSSEYPDYLYPTGPSPLEDTGKGFSQNPVLNNPRLSPNTPWPPASYMRGFGYNPTGEPPFGSRLPANLSVISPSDYY